MKPEIALTLFDYELADAADPSKWVSRADAEKLFAFFLDHRLFRWNDSHNGCEARADGVSLLLEQWNLPHYKAWVFSGGYLKNHIGGLLQHWNYHVAAVLPVKENGRLLFYTLDPATSNALQTMEDWAAGVTAYPHSYHFIKQPHWYIFHQNKITSGNWYARNRRNRKWMLQGLAGINGITATGKAQLAFCKAMVRRADKVLKEAKRWDAI